MNKMYMLLCEICGYKRITDGTDVKDLVEVKTSPLFTGAPKIDPLTKKVVQPKEKKRKKRFKCPKCGRVVFPRKIEKQKGYEPGADNENNASGHQTGDAR
jgi:predicted RNA-binding Zn-ribbon protein involved in translation (DUF1610 family)